MKYITAYTLHAVCVVLYSLVYRRPLQHSMRIGHSIQGLWDAHEVVCYTVTAIDLRYVMDITTHLLHLPILLHERIPLSASRRRARAQHAMRIDAGTLLLCLLVYYT